MAQSVSDGHRQEGAIVMAITGVFKKEGTVTSKGFAPGATFSER